MEVRTAVVGAQREADVAQVDVPAARARMDGARRRLGIAHVAAHEEAASADELAGLAHLAWVGLRFTLDPNPKPNPNPNPNPDPNPNPNPNPNSNPNPNPNPNPNQA